jgi:hypothetical protein
MENANGFNMFLSAIVIACLLILGDSINEMRKGIESANNNPVCALQDVYKNPYVYMENGQYMFNMENGNVYYLVDNYKAIDVIGSNKKVLFINSSGDLVIKDLSQ